MSESHIRNLIKEKLFVILEHELEIDEQVELHTVGMDSMKNIQLAVELEGIFKISIEDDDLLFENFLTLRDLINLVQRNLLKANANVG